MDISQEKRKQTVDYMQDEIKNIIMDYGTREPGSDGENKALEHMKDELTSCCDEVKTETFKVAPHAFMGWVPFVTVFLIFAIPIYFITPVFSLLCIAIAMFPMIGEFVFYRKTLDKLFEEQTSGNILATLKPTGTVTKRIVLNGHSDAAYEWHWHRIGGYKLFLTSIIIPVIGLVLLVGMSIIAIVMDGPIGIPTGWRLYLGYAALFFIPSFITFYFFSDNKTVVPGANDNLTACEMVIGTLKTLKDCGIRMENTEVVGLITGSEEAGLRGAKAFCKNNPTYGHEEGIETIFITFETLRELQHLVVYTRDLNGIVKNDADVSLLAKQAGTKNGMDLRYGSVFCGATDAAAFSQAGLKSTCFAAMAPEVQSYYHTRYDNYDNLDPACIAKVFDITLDMIEQYDKEGLPSAKK